MKELIHYIGNTPLIELQDVSENKNIRLFAKLEGHNPGGSVKDRAALFMIRDALEKKEISKDNILIEATSGNTGIALAMIASLYKIKIELVMPENSTIERVKTMKAFGAKVILTPKEKQMEGAIDYVHDKIKDKKYFMLNQFANYNNVNAHYKGTGPEIYKDTNKEVTHFVSSMGTTGTIMGVSKYLKEQNKDIKIIGVQPTACSQIPGIRRWPKEYLPKIFDEKRVDEIVNVSSEDATFGMRKLAKTYGIFSGMSSGGSFISALRVAKKIEKGNIVFIVCDRGDRYLSEDYFD